jgi:hypothetical protein
MGFKIILLIGIDILYEERSKIVCVKLEFNEKKKTLDEFKHVPI